MIAHADLHTTSESLRVQSQSMVEVFHSSVGSVMVEGMLCKVATCSLHAQYHVMCTQAKVGLRGLDLFVLHQYVQYVHKFSV